MDAAEPCPPPYRLEVVVLLDPATGSWSYSSQLDLPGGRSAPLSDRTWHRWSERWRLAVQLLRADVAIVDAWAGGALEAMPRA